ncbi:hypothetical protein CMUS01_03080 [Colletotrichum musicola]|uniref:Uncharacterized protein n=1 Tax=Colletotrichum musicola TaxID=2175873 RepID=A0A8H6U703_9PEZI|nr:hypothetical protein CMUS01_03080 [Colletotrichum musicola]
MNITPEQLEFAKQLQQEFRNERPSARGGRGGFRGGGGMNAAAAPRMQSYPSPAFHSPMTRTPIQNTGHSNYTLNRTAGTPTPTNSSLEAWLNNDQAPRRNVANSEVQTSSATSARQAISGPVVSKAQPSVPAPQARANPSLEAWLNNEQVTRPNIANREVQTTSASQATTGLVVNKAQNPGHAPHEARKLPATLSSQAAPVPVESHAKALANTETEAATKPEKHQAGASANLVENKEPTALIDLSGQAAPQQHAGDIKSATGDADVSVQKPSLFDVLLKHLNEGKVLPSQQELTAMIQNDGVKPVPQKQVIYGPIDEDEDTIEAQQGPKSGCHCPARARPVRGLGASRHNIDMDGDINLTDMANNAKFAINVILQDHPLRDCPVLQKAMKSFPLDFGAVPATIDTSDDSYEVIPWSSRHSDRPAGGASGRRGLAASLWAD